MALQAPNNEKLLYIYLLAKQRFLYFLDTQDIEKHEIFQAAHNVAREL